MKKQFYLILVLLLVQTALYCQMDKKAKVLIITGMGELPDSHPYSDWYHEHYNDILVSYISDFADVIGTGDLNILDTNRLEQIDLIINNSLFLEPNENQQRAFFEFIGSGNAYFAIHAGHVSFLNSPKYLELIGAKFINHDDIKTMEVMTSDFWYGWEAEDNKKKHAIAEGIGNFTTLDENYLMEFNTKDKEIIARAEYHPIMWTRDWGDGKVLCLTLGHGEYSQTNKGFKALFTNGVKWLLSETKSSTTNKTSNSQ